MARKSKGQREAEQLHAFLFEVVSACYVPLPAIGHTSEEWDIYQAARALRLAQISTATTRASYGDEANVLGAITYLQTCAAEPLGYPVDPPQAPAPADVDAVPEMRP